MCLKYWLCVIAAALLNTCASPTIFAGTAQRPPTIRDLVQLTVLNHRAIAIAPGGVAVAYVAVTPKVDSDSYEMELRVASIEPVVHTFSIATFRRGAVRTPETDGDELPGSFVETGFVLAWSDDGSSLFYAIDSNGGSVVHAWEKDTKTDRVLLTSQQRIANLTFHNRPAELEYCTVEQAPQERTTSDPAFHYDPETFDPTRTDLWRKTDNRTDREDCRDHVLASGHETPLKDNIARKVDPITGTFTGAQPKEYLGWPVTGCFPSPSKEQLLCGSERPHAEVIGEPAEYAWFLATGKDFTQLHELFRIHGKEWQSTTLLWTYEGNVLAIRRGPTSSEIDEYNPSAQSLRTITNLNWGIYNAHLSANDRYLFATRETPNTPPEFCRIDLKTGSILLLDQLNPEFENIRMPRYKPVSIPNEYGDIVNGYLFSPVTDDNKTHPFVAIRGIEEDGFALGTGEECPGLVLAAQGYYVFFFEMSSLPYHPSTKGNTAYTLLRWKSPLISIGKLMNDLAADSKIDKSRTGIAGLSAGADLVDYASAFSQLFHAGEATTGEVPSPPNYLLFDKDRMKTFFANSMTLPFPDTNGISEWSDVSATLHASRSTMPILFQSPDSEALVGFWQPAAMIRVGAPADLYVYPDEGHIKVHPLNRYYVMTRNIQWFDFWLRNVVDPRLEFADQFKRWGEMRADWNAKHLSGQASSGASVPTQSKLPN